VTIDNASTGHARKSLQCALACLPRAGNAGNFYRRMIAGFKLNELGMGTTEAIASFDLDRELTAVLTGQGQDRRATALRLLPDRRAAASPSGWPPREPMPEFLKALVSAGWIRRGAELQESRFWRLLSDESAPMFGVFDDYEKQLIADWIADAPPFGSNGKDGNDTTAARRPNVSRFRRRGLARALATFENACPGQTQPAGAVT
jgi:hypothetical protein